MVHKGSTTKKSASRKSLKKSSSRSHSHASHHTTNSNGFKMFAHCLVCRCKVNINNCKYVMVKGKSSKMRTRIEGVCEKGHKFAQFAKSSGGKSSSKTMKGGAGPGAGPRAEIAEIFNSLTSRNILSTQLIQFMTKNKNLEFEKVDNQLNAEYKRLCDELDAADNVYNNLKQQGR